MTASAGSVTTLDVAYRSDEEAERARDDASEREARREDERRARDEREEALRKVLVELASPQPPFERPEQDPPSRQLRKTISTLTLIAIGLFAAVFFWVFVVVGVDPNRW